MCYHCQSRLPLSPIPARGSSPEQSIKPFAIHGWQFFPSCKACHPETNATEQEVTPNLKAVGRGSSCLCQRMCAGVLGLLFHFHRRCKQHRFRLGEGQRRHSLRPFSPGEQTCCRPNPESSVSWERAKGQRSRQRLGNIAEKMVLEVALEGWCDLDWPRAESWRIREF